MIKDQIFNYRKILSYTQEELAMKLNVSRQTISNWEIGESVPNLEQAKKLSNIFNISLDELAGNDMSSLIELKIRNIDLKAGKTLKIIKINIISILIILLVFGFYYLFDTKAWFVGMGIGNELYNKNGEIRRFVIFDRVDSNSKSINCHNCTLEELIYIKKTINERKISLDSSAKIVEAYFNALGYFIKY